MEGARANPAEMSSGKGRPKIATDTTADLSRPETILRQIKKLEADMFRKARNLEFEEAARLRDQIEKLKKIELGLPATRVG
jgi:excinuclease ABC subunit B